jgi:hypothetical protein
MKNLYRERLRFAAKKFHRFKRGSRFELGVIAPYAFDDADPGRLTWWTDVVFIMNDYRVMLSWIHPRYVYDEKVREEAERRVGHIAPTEQITSPLMKKVGRSRKKIAGSRVRMVDHGRSEAQAAQVSLLNRGADYQIAPFMKSTWTPYHRLVELCIPVEIRNNDDLLDLVALARRLLKREVLLEEAFPLYLYTRESWRAESHDYERLTK